MKRVITADIHCNASTYGETDHSGLSWRSDDFRDAFRKMVDRVLEVEKPEEIFINGDLFDHPHPDNVSRTFFASQVKRLSLAKIDVHILIGNHDSNSQGHPLMEMQEIDLPNVNIYYDTTILEEEDALILIMPQTPDVENKHLSIREKLFAFIEESRDRVVEAKNSDKKVIFFGHFPVSGAFMNDGTKDKSSDHIMVLDLDAIGADFVFLGDFHRYQKLDTKSCDAYYSGSLERTNIFDIASDKGFINYEDGKASFVSLNENPRPMFDISGSGDEIIEQIENIGDNAKGAIIRLHFVGEKSDLELDDDKISKLKKRLEREVGARHVYRKNTCTNKEREEKAQNILDKLQEDGESFEEKDTERIVQLNIDQEQFGDDEKENIRTLALDIINTVNKEMAI